ncbi:hypothetical protein CSUB01_07116 [Colletotrichum sublineola]|uniref:Transmembrane protein n=1 Tax=Colletotrichum sublineola TaxID=1173701 RepID=A0A066WXM2_COLSU|nr:hypothetical protein CSUB01_07116 [Colletotrichum sublineola]
MNVLPLPSGLSEAGPLTDPSANWPTLPAGTLEGSGPTRTADEGEPASTGNDKATQISEDDSGGSSASLPVGAKAGIGVGVGIFGVTCIACFVMLYRYLKPNQKALAEAQESMAQPPAYFHGMPVSPVSAVQSPTRSTQETAGFYVNSKPVEIA